MQIRNIGIVGYAVAGPVAFLLMGKNYWPTLPGTTFYKVRGCSEFSDPMVRIGVTP